MSEITQTQVKSFYKNGFLVLKNIIPKDIVIQAKHNIDISLEEFNNQIKSGRARSTIIPEPNITTNTTNFIGDQIIEDLSWSPPPEKEEKLVMNEIVSFFIHSAIPA